MTGYRLPKADIARLNRVVTAFEAGQGNSAAATQIPRGPILTQWMLNEPFRPGDDDDAPFNPEAAYGRRFQAQAFRCEPTTVRAQTLRIKNLDFEGSTEFRIRFDGQESAELPDDLSAEELQAALTALPGLENMVAVIGHQTEMVDATDSTPAVIYQPRQWHIFYSDDLAATTLPELVAGSHNLRLFRDWILPTVTVDTVWTGLPNDARLEPGAFGFCYPFPVLGWTWVHGECWAKAES